MKNKHVLIVTAHLDDFEIGMGGTAAALCKHNNVYLVVLCRGDRPGYEHVSLPRKETCIDNCNKIGMSDITLYEYSDTTLDTIPQTEICNLIHDNIVKYNPSVVYTHNCSDVHKDHRIVSECVRVSTRMRKQSSVNELYEFTIPGSTEWSHIPVNYNVYVNISSTRNIKNTIIEKYNTEVRLSPDPVSIDMIEARDRYYGSICGYSYAEAFRLIFKR